MEAQFPFNSTRRTRRPFKELKTSLLGAAEEHHRRYDLAKRLWSKIEGAENHILASMIPRKLPRSGKYLVENCRMDRFGISYFPFMTRMLNGLLRLYMYMYRVSQNYVSNIALFS